MFVLRELLRRGIIIYLNDILIATETRKEHKRLIKRVHELLAETDLYIKKKKCRYFQSRIKFLSYILTEEKIKKNSEKLTYIQN